MNTGAVRHCERKCHSTAKIIGERTDDCCRMSVEIDVDVLISLVEARPTLWDKTIASYKNRNETKEAWKEVCIGLNSSFEELDDNEKNKFGELFYYIIFLTFAKGPPLYLIQNSHSICFVYCLV